MDQRRLGAFGKAALSRVLAIRGVQINGAQAVQLGMLLLLIVVAIQLGGIWNELRHIRHEQLKNMYYRFPEATAAQIVEHGETGDFIKRQYESTCEVHIDGTVDVNVRNPR